MIVKQTLFITLLSFYLALLSDSQQILEKKKVVVDIDKSLTKYLVKFYKHRLVEGHNNAISPLLDLYALVLLYKVSDASAKTDLHTLLGIPEDAEDGTMDKFEAKIRLYLEQSGGNSAFGTQLFVDSRIKDARSYTLFVISTALFKNLNCTGLVLAADGQKMSKRKKNYPDPVKAVHKYGADAAAGRVPAVVLRKLGTMARPVGLILATFTDDLVRMAGIRRGAPSRGREAPAPIASPAAAKAKAPKESTKGKVLFVGNLKRTINIQQLAA
ncbi:hypothetical protein pipiens_011288 [Culex pipiens pipiens]|uniref:Aminoacyl-tRNA synthetase class Ia domain-containing protein n=1 Tax=Culex pipiens pipiens TaxID=38569 RepID=A0ABD1D7I2_CULPP